MIVATISGAAVRHPGGRVVTLPDLCLGAGERVAVLGRNGSGKTTLLRVLAGLQDAEGAVDVRVAAAETAFVPAKPYLLRGDALWNVALPLAARGVARHERRARAAAALEELGALTLADRQRSALSDGEMQRVALARALVVRPRLLLLDEPLGSLDAAGADVLARALAAREDLTVVAAAPGAPAFPGAVSARVVQLSGGGNR